MLKLTSIKYKLRYSSTVVRNTELTTALAVCGAREKTKTKFNVTDVMAYLRSRILRLAKNDALPVKWRRDLNNDRIVLIVVRASKIVGAKNAFDQEYD